MPIDAAIFDEVYAGTPEELVHDLTGANPSVFSSIFNTATTADVQLTPDHRQRAEEQLKTILPKYKGTLDQLIKDWRKDLAYSAPTPNVNDDDDPPELCKDDRVFDARRREFVDSSVLAPQSKKRKRTPFDVHKFIASQENEGKVYTLNVDNAYNDYFFENSDWRSDRKSADEGLRAAVKIAGRLNQTIGYKLLEYTGEQRIN